MANRYFKRYSETEIRIGEVMFSYMHVFSPTVPKSAEEQSKYSVQIRVPKSDTETIAEINRSIEAAKQIGISSKFGGKKSGIQIPVRDGSEKEADDESYKGYVFFNANANLNHKPQIMMRDPDFGGISEALSEDDVYSGCFGAVTVNFFPYNHNGKLGIAVSLGNILKTRDGERLGGGKRAADVEFDDLKDID